MSIEHIHSPSGPEGEPFRPLDNTDLPWLTEFFDDNQQHENEARLTDELNTLLVIGSRHIDNYSETDHRDAIIEARKDFMSHLPKLEANINTIESTHPLLMPLDTITETLRVLHAAHIDVRKAVSSSPRILTFSPNMIKERLINLEKFGFKITAAIENMPSLLMIAPEQLDSRAQTLSELGLDQVAVLRRQPYILAQPSQIIREKVQALADLGIDAIHVISKSLSILGNSTQTIEHKLDFMSELGLDAVKIVNKSPSSIGLTTELIKQKIDLLSSKGLNAVQIINKYSKVLEYAPSSLGKKVRNIRAIYRYWGLNESAATDLIETWPTILGYKPSRARTIGRIVANVIEPRRGVAQKDIQSLMITNHPAVIVAYINEGTNVDSLKELRNKASAYKKLGEQALSDIINSHTDNPIVKAHLVSTKN